MSSKESEDVTYFKNSDGKKIACRYWKPADNPRALVLLCHGVGEHSGCYDDFAKLLAEQGFLVFGHDHIGHGLSEGDRVHINTFSQYTQDLFQHIDIMVKDNPGCPVFIIGHSMGGTITLKAVLEKQDLFKGVLLIGPAIRPNPATATRFKVTMAKVVSSIMPQLGVAPIQPKLISRDQNIVEKYEKDPLVWHGKLKARWAVQIMRTMQEIEAHMSEITIPIYVIQGSEDKLVEYSGFTVIQENVGSTDKTFKMVEGAFHQVHNEPDGVGSQAMDEMCTWIKDRCDA